MNESEFEQQLRSISPAKPRHALEQRIAAELVPVPGTAQLQPAKRSWLDRLLPAFGWSAAGAAAGIAITLAFSGADVDLPKAATVAIAPRVEPATDAESVMELEHEVLDVADAGIIGESENGFARIVRYESLERRRWVGTDGAVTVVELPREDLVLVPVSFQ